MRTHTVLFYLSLSVLAVLSLDSSDQDALKSILQEWTTPPKGWDINNVQSACNWEGLVCSGGRLIVFNLRTLGSHDDMKFPAAFCQLTALQQLNLENFGWGNATSIPSCISNLTLLTEISVNSIIRQNYKFVGELPDLTNATELVRVDFSGLKMNIAQVPSWVFTLQNLNSVRLQGNLVSGTIDYDAVAATNLTVLLLSPSTLPCPTYKDKALLKKMPGINVRVNSNCPLLTLLSQSSALIDLMSEFRTCLVPGYPTDEQLLDICAKPGKSFVCDNDGYVTVVQLEGSMTCQTVPKIPDSIAQLIKMITFIAYKVPIDTITPSLALPSLSTLQFEYNGLSGQIPNYFCNLTLNFLSFANNNFTSAPDCLYATMLDTLYVQQNSLAGNLPRTFCNFSGSEIDLSHNEFSGDFPACGIVRKIYTLDLSHNKFQRSFPFHEYNSHKLMLNDNEFSGNLPADMWGTYEYFTFLYVQNNKFTGPIPPPTPVYWLATVNMSNNHLNGNIPNLRNLSRLEYFDVRNNHNMSGVIPENMLYSVMGGFYIAGTNLTCPDTDDWRSRNWKWDACKFPVIITSSTPRPTYHDDGSIQVRGLEYKWFAIIGGVLGVCLLVAIVVFVLVKLRQRQRNKMYQSIQ